MMSLAPSPAWTAYDPDAPASLWAIGTAPSAGGPVEYALSNRDVEADALWAARQLDALGIGQGSLIDLIHNYREGGQFWPFYLAALRIGAVVLNGMATPWDVGRTEMYARRFDLRAVVGVGEQTLEGLGSFGFDPAKVFDRLPVLVAREGAVAALKAAGLDPHSLAVVGPIVLISAPGEEGALYDTDEWAVEAQAEGRLSVTAVGPRACGFDRLDTGRTGRVVDGRIHLDPAS
jgi:hypothetical protein